MPYPSSEDPEAWDGPPLRGEPRSLLFLLLQVGFTDYDVTAAARELLPHAFTLATPSSGKPEYRRAVCFLWHSPWGHPRSALPTTLPCGARTFLPCLRTGGLLASAPAP